MGAGGRADGKRGHRRGGPHLQTQAWTGARGGDPGETGPGQRGRTLRLGSGPRSSRAALGQAWRGGKDLATHPWRGVFMAPHSGPNPGGVAGSPRGSALVSDWPPHMGLRVLNVQGGSGKGLGFFPGEPHSRAVLSGWRRAIYPQPRARVPTPVRAVLSGRLAGLGWRSRLKAGGEAARTGREAQR